MVGHRGEPVGAAGIGLRAATTWAARGEREQRVAAPVRRRARVRRAARAASTRSVAAALRLTITASSPVGGALAGLEAEAGVEAREARRRAAKGAVRHSSSLTSSTASLGVELGPVPPARASAPSARATPPFMSTAPEPVSRSPSRSSGRCASCGHDGVEVAEQQHAPPPAAEQATRTDPGRGRASSRRGARPRPRAAGRRWPAQRIPRRPATSPEGDETPTSASSSRSAASARRAAASIIPGSRREVEARDAQARC